MNVNKWIKAHKNDTLFLAATVSLLVVTFLPIPYAPIIFVMLLVLWHGVQRYGLKTMAVFFVISQVVSNVMENLSISTGVPFGNYHYSAGSGIPFLFQVPITIGLAYFAYGYLAWAIANVLLNKTDERLKSWVRTVVLPLTASFIMVMWDVVMDPINSTINHYWIWEEGGGYNGVPLTNYLGWFLTVYIFYQLFALYLRRNPKVVRPQTSKIFWATPAVMYFLTALSFVVIYMSAQHGVVIDAVGQAWNKQDIYETAAIVSIYTMMFPAFLAFIKAVNLPKNIRNRG